MPLVFDYVGSSGEGGTITGSFGYDTAALDQVPGNNSLGQYKGLGLSGSHQQ